MRASCFKCCVRKPRTGSVDCRARVSSEAKRGKAKQSEAKRSKMKQQRERARNFAFTFAICCCAFLCYTDFRNVVCFESLQFNKNKVLALQRPMAKVDAIWLAFAHSIGDYVCVVLCVCCVLCLPAETHKSTLTHTLRVVTPILRTRATVEAHTQS